MLPLLQPRFPPKHRLFRSQRFLLRWFLRPRFLLWFRCQCPWRVLLSHPMGKRSSSRKKSRKARALSPRRSRPHPPGCLPSNLHPRTMSTIHLTERKLVARFPLLLLCATLTATGQENAVVESLLSNGKKQVAAGDLEAGCRSFEQAIQAQQKANLPKHPRLGAFLEGDFPGMRKSGA